MGIFFVCFILIAMILVLFIGKIMAREDKVHVITCSRC